MLATLVLAIAGTIVVEPPMVPSFFTGEQIYAICRQPDDAQCQMYVAGALDGILFVRFSERTTRLCPSQMSTRDAADILVDYLEAHPEARKLAGAAAARKALAPRIECDESKLTLQEGSLQNGK